MQQARPQTRPGTTARAYRNLGSSRPQSAASTSPVVTPRRSPVFLQTQYPPDLEAHPERQKPTASPPPSSVPTHPSPTLPTLPVAAPAKPSRNAEKPRSCLEETHHPLPCGKIGKPRKCRSNPAAHGASILPPPSSSASLSSLTVAREAQVIRGGGGVGGISTIPAIAAYSGPAQRLD